MPEFGLCRHFVARIRDPYIGAKCYINVLLCHAMLCHAPLCQHTVTQSQQYSLLFSLSALSAQLLYIFPALLHEVCWHQPLLIFFQRIVSLFQRCYSTTFSMSLFKDFVQRWFPFFKSSLLFPKTFCFQVLCSMFGLKDFFQNFSFTYFFDRISEDFVKDDAHVSKCFQRFVSKSLFEIAHILCNDSFLYIFFT